MNALLFLENEVNAFSISNAQFNNLCSKCDFLTFSRAVSEEEILSKLADTDIFITWQFKDSWYQLAPHLKAIFTPAAGNDWIQRDRRYPVPVYNGTFHGKIMVESLLGMILYHNRRFDKLTENKQNKIYNRNIESTTSILHNQKVMIIGYGNIGKIIARTLKTFDCEIIGVKRTLPSQQDPLINLMITPAQLLEHIGHADHVITILPNDTSTDNLLGLEHFKAMKRSAFFYNIGRGNCYKESVIVEALEKEYISGAGLDVFESEPIPENSRLWGLPQVLIMPHASAICKEYLDLYIKELVPRIETFCNRIKN